MSGVDFVVVQGKAIGEVEFEYYVVLVCGEVDEVLYCLLGVFMWKGGEGRGRTPPCSLAFLVIVRGMGWKAIEPMTPGTSMTEVVTFIQ